MEIVKKSFNLTPGLARRIDSVVAANPGLSFTVIVNQALEGVAQESEALTADSYGAHRRRRRCSHS